VAARTTLLALALTRLAALGLISEILVGEKLLLARSENEVGPAVDTLQYSILKLWHLPGSCDPVRIPHYPRESFSTHPILGCWLKRFTQSAAVIRNPGDSSSGFFSGPTPA
jgi:hypothetical protein